MRETAGRGTTGFEAPSSHLGDCIAMSAPRFTTVCVGLATLDTIVRVERPTADDFRVIADLGAVTGGGPAATAAVAIARLGVEVAFVGRIGDDEAGTTIRRGLEREGVDTRFLRTLPGTTSPFSAITISSATGERGIMTHAGTAGPIALTDDELETCAGARWVHVDHAGAPTVTQLRAARGRAGVSVDGGNPIADLDLACVDLYAPAQAELGRVSGSADAEAGLRWALSAGARLAVVTRGSAGVSAAATFSLSDGTAALLEAPRDGVVRDVVTIDALAVEPLSTLGAGDAFHGALVAGLATGASAREALRLANAVAAISCRGLDGRSGIPRRDDPALVAALAERR